MNADTLYGLLAVAAMSLAVSGCMVWIVYKLTTRR
jgi:hypothetical protein